MNETLIKNHNSVVKPNDTVYHLGDFAFYNTNQYLKRLNGNHLLIRGNHDPTAGLEGFGWVKDTYLLKNVIPCVHIWMSHYAHRIWPQSHYSSLHLFGHSHNKLPPYGRSFDVGVDTHNFYPYSLEEVIEKAKTLEPIFLVGKDYLKEN